MSRFAVQVVIPSAVDDAGIATDHFELGNINLLPAAHKTLIEYLIDDLRKSRVNKYLSSIHLVVRSDLRHLYLDLLASKQVTLHTTESYQRRGILATTSEAIEENPKRPILIIYGDTTVQDEVMRRLLVEAERTSRRFPRSPWAVLALAKSPKRQPERRSLRNRWGYLVVRKKPHRSDHYVLNESDILDILYRPSYRDLIPHDPEREDLLIETGIMIISPVLWKKLLLYQSADPWGLHSIPGAARQCFIELGFRIRGLVINMNEWLDVNYPWEFLMANQYLMQRLAFQSSPKRAVDYDPRRHFVFNSWETSLEKLRKRCHLESINCVSKARPLDEIRFDKDDVSGNQIDRSEVSWGIHKDALVDGTLILPLGRRNSVGRVFIGKGTIIRGTCVLKEGVRIADNSLVEDSVLCEDVSIGPYSEIRQSVLMPAACVGSHCSLIHSILGKAVQIENSVVVEYKDDQEDSPGEYTAECQVIKHRSPFGAIIGDGCKIGSFCLIHRGRKIGKGCKIGSNVEIRTNISPLRMISRSEDTATMKVISRCD